MCIDLLSYGHRLDVPLLMEQIWFNVDEGDYSSIKVVEVYDLLIRNPKGSKRGNGENPNQPLTEIWAILSNDCQTDDLNYTIRVGKLTPAASNVPPENVPDRKFNWPLTPTEWAKNKEGRSIKRGISTESADTLSANITTLEGRLLRPTLDFPDVLSISDRPNSEEDIKQCQYRFKGIKKTLFRISFRKTPLFQGENGWLRLIVDPVRLDARKAEQSIYNEGVYEQRLDVTTPDVMRSVIANKFETERTSDGRIVPATDEVSLDLAWFIKGLDGAGTSTRIADHRIALLVPSSGIEIYDPACATHGAAYYGLHDLSERKRRVFLWGGGSLRNQEDDLVHNAMRVLDRVADSPGIEKRQLRAELASGRHEVLSLLINVMSDDDVGLLKSTSKDKTDNGNLTLPPNISEYPRTEYNVDFDRLRERWVKRMVEERDKRLVTALSDSHPFRIFYRAVYK